MSNYFKKKNEDDFIFNVKSNSLFEDLLEKKLEKRVFILYSIFVILIFVFFLWKAYQIQIIDGDKYLAESKKNFLRSEILFSDRGVVTDRNGRELIWNVKNKNEREFSGRYYLENIGLSHILGFLSYPKRDKWGKFFTKEYTGKAGVEKYFNEYLNGKLGKRILKTNARGKIISENNLIQSEPGKNLKLTIDLDLQKELYLSLKKYIIAEKFQGGAGIIIDVETGEILSSVSLPEYNSNVMVEAEDKKKIKGYLQDRRNIFLNRVFLGGYTPGSIVKPFVGLGGLEYDIITPQTTFKTNGRLVLPNKWDPSKPTIFSDWKNHGKVDLNKAISWSSNVFFYIVGGGLKGIENYTDRKGLGINRLDKIYTDFGFGEKTGIEKFKEKTGLVPNPEWKMNVFKRSWNIGNTYFSSIGQFGFLATPLQSVVAVAGLANGGKIIKPIISELGGKSNIKKRIEYSMKNYQAIHKAMRETVLSGTTQSLNVNFVKIAAKSGTAQIKNNTKVNSWVIGFWPYKKPKYAFVLLADEGPKHYKHSVSWAMGDFIKSLNEKGITKYWK